MRLYRGLLGTAFAVVAGLSFAPVTASAADSIFVPLLSYRTGPFAVSGAPIMRRYLKEFLSDRRVIEENRLKWWLVLNLIILTVRPGRKGRDYDKIWNKERNESPLKTITRSQAEKLASTLEPLGTHG